MLGIHHNKLLGMSHGSNSRTIHKKEMQLLSTAYSSQENKWAISSISEWSKSLEKVISGNSKYQGPL